MQEPWSFAYGTYDSYEEIETLRDPHFLNLIIGKKSYHIDIRDVRKVLSMEKIVEELREFDDDKLYPYVVELIERLCTLVNDVTPILNKKKRCGTM